MISNIQEKKGNIRDTQILKDIFFFGRLIGFFSIFNYICQFNFNTSFIIKQQRDFFLTSKYILYISDNDDGVGKEKDIYINI